MNVSQATSVGRSPVASVNPYTNELVREFAPMSDEAVDDAVRTAHEAFATWRRVSSHDRAAVVRRAGELLAQRAEQLARTVTLEMGKLISHSRSELELSARILDYFAREGPRMLEPQPLAMDSGSARLLSEPLGVILAVEPWNFPIYQVVRLAAPNLVLGNVIVLKHAGSTPQTAIALERLFVDAGAPAGVYTNLLITSAAVARVIENPLVRGVSLTGSERAGESVGERAGGQLKKSVLELGGSDPFIVLDGEQLDRTVHAAMVGRMHNMGQSCVSAKRMIVVSDVFDAFVDSLAGRLRELQPGDPADEATTLAPLSSERAAQLLIEQVHDALEKGARAVTGGQRLDRPGAFVQPTLLTGVRPGMRAYSEELFGPVAVVYSVQDDDHAVALANATPYGLGGSVFCADIERAEAVAERIESGMVWINHPTSSEPQLPFGGIKRSGYGRELSRIGIEEFANRKLVAIAAPDAPITDALG